MQLYINQPGCSLRLRDGVLTVRPPANEGEEQRIPFNRVERLFLNRAVHLSAEVLFAAAELDVDVIFTDRNGQPVARLWSNRFGSIATIRKQQLLFCQSHASLDWVQQLLAEKIDTQVALLGMLEYLDRSNEAIILQTINRLFGAKERIRTANGATLADAAGSLRAAEAAASKAYWQCVSACLPRQYRFDTRSQHPAKDMFNAMLNYAYGMLYSKVESALIKAGVDPFIGIFHSDGHNRPALVFDVIEKFRYWVDYVVIHLCRQEVVFLEFFDVKDEAFWLNEHGKRILIQTVNDYFEEVTPYNGLERSRNTHIDLYAHMLATMFKTWKA